MYPGSNLRTDIARGLSLMLLVASLVSCNLANPFSSNSTPTPGFGSVTITASNVSRLVKAWSYTLGGTAQFSTTPIVANGMIYIGVDPHTTGSGTGTLYALDAVTGNERWSLAISGSISTAPTVVDGMIYIDAANYDNSSETDTLYVLDTRTGTRLWSYSAGTTRRFSATPTVANGVIYIGSEDVHIDSTNGILEALDAKTGTKLWSYSAGTTRGFSTAPTVANGVVYVGSDDGTMYALDARTGSKLWSYNAGSNLTTPTVANGVVYIASVDNSGNGTLDALDTKTGSKLWSYAAGAPSSYISLSAPTVVNGVVYIASVDASGNGTLDALDTKTGSKLWSYAVGAPSSFTSLSAPTVANGVVYIGSEDDSGNDTLDALNATSGKKEWSYNIRSGFTVNDFAASLAVANGVIYVGELDGGELSALDAKSGTRLWTYFTGVALASLPTVTNTITYVNSRKTLYAYAVSTRQAPTPTATSSSSNGTTTAQHLVPSINQAPVFADVAGLHIQSTEGLQCPLSGRIGQSDDLVFTTGRLTYSKDEIQQIRNYLHEMPFGSESITTAYTITPPPTLHWVSGSAVCTLNLEISNTGNTTVQISSLGVQLASAPQPNGAQSFHTLDVCSVADKHDTGALGCNGGRGAGGGACGLYTVDIALKAAPAASIFAVAPFGVGGGCPEPTLHPNDTIEFHMYLSSPGTKKSTVAPYIYALVPVLTVTDANGSHNLTLSSMAGIAAFVNRQQITCYGLLHDQDTTFVPVSTFPANTSTLCLA